MSTGWREAGLRYQSIHWFLGQKFGCRVAKVSVDAGFTCPNVDGTVGSGGCVFCNIRSFSPSRRWSGAYSITQQIDETVRRLRRPRGPTRFLAYFQPATNTYAPVDRLRTVFAEAANHPDIVGLLIGTRPDCVPEETLDLLAEFSRRTWVVIEYGLQTIHARSLEWLQRGHTLDAFLDAAARTRARGLAFGVHLILGIPGETRDDVLATARVVAASNAHSIKLHNLYAVRDTRLAELVSHGKVRLLDLDECARQVVDFLEVTPPECVVDRLGGTAPPEYLVAPPWCQDKSALRLAVEAEFVRRDSWQGKMLRASSDRAAGTPPRSPSVDSNPRPFSENGTGRKVILDSEAGRMAAGSQGKGRHIGSEAWEREESPGSTGQGGG